MLFTIGGFKADFYKNLMKEMLEGNFRGGDVKGIRPEVLRRLIQEFLQIIGLPDDDIVNIFTNVIYKIYPGGDLTTSTPTP